MMSKLCPDLYLAPKTHVFKKKVILVSISKTVGNIKNVAPLTRVYFLFYIRWWYLKSDRTYIL